MLALTAKGAYEAPFLWRSFMALIVRALRHDAGALSVSLTVTP